MKNIIKSLICLFLITNCMIYFSNIVSANDIVENSIKVKSVFFPQYLSQLGINSSKSSDRTDLGIQINKNSVIEFMQTNSNYKGKVEIELFNYNSKNEKKIVRKTIKANECNKWISLSANDKSVPFIKSIVTNEKNIPKELPIIKYRYKKSETSELLIYKKGMNQQEILNKWKGDDYFLIQGNREQILLTPNDCISVKQKEYNFDDVINFYDNEVIPYINSCLGFDETTNARFFYSADITGPGSLYYSPGLIACSSNKAETWLETNPSKVWHVFHETGHGYQGKFMYTGNGMNVNETWNNLYGLYFQQTKTGLSKWLYNGNKELLENQVYALHKNNISYNDKISGMKFKPRLLVLGNLLDGDNGKSMISFYKNYQLLSASAGFKAKNYQLPDLLAEYCGKDNNKDIAGALLSFNLNVDNSILEKNREEGRLAYMYLCDVIPDDKWNTAINELLLKDPNYRLKSIFSLINNSQIDSLGYKGNLKINLDGYIGNQLYLIRDNKIIESKNIDSNEINFDNINNGIYDIIIKDKDNNIITKKYYVCVKDDKSEISIQKKEL